MDVSSLRECGLIPATRSEHAGTPGYGGRNTSFTQEQREERARRSAEWRSRQNGRSPNDNSAGRTPNGGQQMRRQQTGGRMNQEQVAMKKARELYVGNLTTGLCDKEKLINLFKPACIMLPEYVESMGPAILSVDVRGGGTFAFVEFQNERMATAALGIFDKMEVCGRCINVGRPNGYNGPTPNEANNFGKVSDDDCAEPAGNSGSNKLAAMTPTPGNGSTNGTPQRSNSGVSGPMGMTPTPNSASMGHGGPLQHQNSTISMMSDGMNGAIGNGGDPNMMMNDPNMMMNGGFDPSMGPGPMMNGPPVDQFGNPMNGPGMDNSGMMMNGGFDPSMGPPPMMSQGSFDPNMPMNGGFDPNMGPPMNGMGMPGGPMDPHMMGGPGPMNGSFGNFGPPGQF